MTGARVVVAGIGNDYRRDDGIGPAVARAVEKLRLPGVLATVCDGEPTGLLDAWAGADLAVVVDAVLCEPATPGRIWLTTVDALRGVTTAASSHALGIPDAIPLGAVLGRLPREIVVVAVEAQTLELGAGLSEPVAAAVPEAIRVTLREVERVLANSR
ncbi:hydrogenase maturation protease [Nocardia sp. alder85J]|uniref:hydrogenase maturation protease n=1 Tax=Nocardia sp. alder85J TaxID=2862949 RepID=UPI001CD3C74A|nr:hydrogenase maturation protease [Nocardia sp. alder85J]MCX4092460.1 hydrogenase maturation protease [Nocardia sp. alder85J]